MKFSIRDLLLRTMVVVVWVFAAVLISLIVVESIEYARSGIDTPKRSARAPKLPKE